jgi:D-alanyl-D-alanine carboxypeptidase/D-alanyl-D-alanine-endopeptidase (penicillin-binding protein 4)
MLARAAAARQAVAMRRAVLVLVAASIVCAAGPAAARAPWKRRLDRLASGHRIGIAIHQRGRFVYGWASKARRVPASNQKLLASMALLDRFGARSRIPTVAAVRRMRGGVVRGRLWVLGRGDPTVSASGRYGRSLPFSPTWVRPLARRIQSSGVRRVAGRVVGSTGYFRRDWDAPGWRAHYRSLYVARPTALTVDGNTRRGRHVAQPERMLARELTKELRKLGVSVAHRGRAGRPPRGLRVVARVASQPLAALLRHMNRSSSNFFAEVLGKRLARSYGPPGTIAAASRALRRWARSRGVRVRAHDASGLSRRNRMSPRGLVRLLVAAQRAPWGGVLKRSLPRPGQGTLDGRLRGVRMRAKTGTLRGVSALSGWVWRRRPGTWARFAILSRGLPKHRAVALENRVVRVVAGSGRLPAVAAAPSSSRYLV